MGLAFRVYKDSILAKDRYPVEVKPFGNGILIPVEVSGRLVVEYVEDGKVVQVAKFRKTKGTQITIGDQ